MADRSVVLALVYSDTLHTAMAAHAQDFDVRWTLDSGAGHAAYADHPEVVSVAALNPALIIIDLNRPADWLYRVRSDPATRRIPVIAIADDGPARDRAQAAHVAAIFTTPELIEALPDAITTFARVFQQSAALLMQCESVPPADVIKGLHEFNAHEYYECHETLEHAWMNEPGPVRELYRVILQVGIAYYQIQRGNYPGAQKMFRRTLQWFAPLPDRCQGIDLAGLRADAAAAWEHLEALGPGRIQEFDMSLLKPVRFEDHE
ncbi:MAG TPA: DUF309 domain-containing protein [Aggregatilineales bacterium]|nr:DUF309 domain-containing protein [Aggregatilineales bacterium]